MIYRFSPDSHALQVSKSWLKRSLLLASILASCNVNALPTNMGTFTIINQDAANGTANGTYVANKADGTTGAGGTFTISRNETRGYGNVTFLAGSNGIEIKNNEDINIDKDKFEYTFTITPNDNTSIHTIKIGQASYTTTGNSEVARQTLKYTPYVNPNISVPTQAVVKENPSISYFFGAMGDYFMGKRLSGNSFSSNNSTTSPQLRVNDLGSLYYYSITALNGSGSSTSFIPTTNARGEVSFGAQKRGTLPPTPTFENILKESSINPNNKTSYAPLNTETILPTNSSYVSYGIENSRSNYVLAVRNAKTVTLTYEGIMRGNSSITTDVIGETFNEWISFGVESEPLYTFSGTVFNDNGGIDDNNANASTIGGIYNNADYFNGTLNSTEKGVSGSTVRLVNDCANPTIEYASQTLTSTDTSQIGKYQFTVLPSVIGNRNSVCIIETRADSSYPIRTNTGEKAITLTSNNYTYSNNNFGRVIAKNVALVLTKYQYINDCPTTLDYTKVSSRLTDTPNTGFSTKSIDNIKPGKCIAYKITATNRANLAINNFILQDVLQEKNVNGATVTSVLANPPRIVGEFNDGLNVGDNGTVRTVSLNLDARSQRNFYFNTKYGTAQLSTPNTP